MPNNSRLQAIQYQPWDKFYQKLVDNHRVRQALYQEYDTTLEEWGIDLLIKQIPNSKSEIEKKFSIELEKHRARVYVIHNGRRYGTVMSKSALAKILWSYVVDPMDYLPLWVQENRGHQVTTASSSA